MNQVEKEKERKGGEDGNQELQPQARYPRHEIELLIMMNQQGIHLYKRLDVQVLISTTKLEEKGRGKGERSGQQRDPRKSYP
jgi:hypothetical protein